MTPSVKLSSRARIAVVLTRDIEVDSGRSAIISRMLQGLRRDHEVVLFRLRSLFELCSAMEIIAACCVWLRSALAARPLPLQCLLYASRRQCFRLANDIQTGNFSAIYLDTVRCQILLRRLRHLLPDTHIVCDFDDLMSRRMSYLAEKRLPLLLGHTVSTFPRWMARLVEGPLAWILPRYEAYSLGHAEKEVAEASSAIVLISRHECDIFATRLAPEFNGLHAIPPPMDVRTAPWGAVPAIRFVFVGSDRLLQNRMAIDYLLARWRDLKPPADLHIFGKQSRNPCVTGVHWRGFVQNLADVYKPGSVLLCPAFIAGGVKTKVAEAWSYGCPVLGNAAAFEGLFSAEYPLNLPEDRWDDLLRAPQEYGPLWSRAAALGQDFVARHLTSQNFNRAWARAIGDMEESRRDGSPSGRTGI